MERLEPIHCLINSDYEEEMGNPFDQMVNALRDKESQTGKKTFFNQDGKESKRITFERPAGGQSANVFEHKANKPCDRATGVLIIFMRLREVKKEIERCFEAIGVKGTFSEFYRHVNDKLENFEPTLKEISLYIPTFYRVIADNYNQESEVKTDNHKWLQNKIDCLETAMAFWIAAKAIHAKPLSNLLSEAIARCEAANKIHSDQMSAAQDAAQASRAARVKGGKIRHEKNEPARHEAARLLRAARPSTGWHSPLSAAKVICPALTIFIRANGLSIQVAEGLPRTVVRWIKNHPDVQFAYQGGLQTTL